jgi:5'-3' exonuclease
MTILIVDGFNNFMRNFAANQAVTASGDLVGGVVGFINTLKWAYKVIQPKEIIVVWEQGGASPRRKSIDPGYKSHSHKQSEIKEFNSFRQDGRPNPFFDEENKPKQLSLLISLLDCLPIYQIYVENTECDDIIAYLVKSRLQPDPQKKIILSGDKDFYQLLTEPLVEIYDPLKKQFIDREYVKERFGVIPENVCLLRTMIGDESDTLHGIHGLGEKTAIKLFPELVDQEKDVAWLKETAQTLVNQTKKPSKALLSLTENFSTVEKNWKLMYLGLSSLSASQIDDIDRQLETRNNILRKMEFVKILHAAKMQQTQEWDFFLSELKKLVHLEKA